jgi:hypothetical protein
VGGPQGRRVVVPVDSAGTPPVHITGYVGEHDSPPNSPYIISYSPASKSNQTSHVFVSDFPAGPITVFAYASDGTFQRCVYP